jgi:hypothetical protein
MSLKLADCEEELRTAKERMKEITAALNALGSERMELDGVIQGWEAILANKRKANGEQAPPPAADTSTVITEADLDYRDPLEEEAGENKTQFVRDQIKAHGAKGITPADLKAAADAAGIVRPVGWPYGPIQRLKKKGEIVKRRGRLYPKDTNLAMVG